MILANYCLTSILLLDTLTYFFSNKHIRKRYWSQSYVNDVKYQNNMLADVALSFGQISVSSLMPPAPVPLYFLPY